MYRLLETIKCHNGQLFHLAYHNERMNKARKECFGLSNEIDLSEVIRVPEKYRKGLFRCRVTYSQVIEKIKFLPHKYRKVESLKLIEDNQIDYHLKYSDRKTLQKLFNKKEDCDDILILKNGYVTDSFTANTLFFDGKVWWTPDTPLLEGTQRERLLKEKLIHPCKITKEDLPKYKIVGLINAMQDLDNMPIISVGQIKV